MLAMRLDREPTTSALATFGVLSFVADSAYPLPPIWRAWTLEDAIREVVGVPVATWKVQDDTAIPQGVYTVQLTMSTRFRRITPELIGVNGFSAIRMHSGMTIEDTRGCVLVGQRRHASGLAQSRLAFESLMSLLTTAPDGITIDVRNPVDWTPVGPAPLSTLTA